MLHGLQVREPKEQRVLEEHGPMDRRALQEQHAPGLGLSALQELEQRGLTEQNYAQLR